MFTAAYWRDLAERMISTGAFALLSTWGVGDVALNALHLDWTAALGIFLGGALLSLVKGLAARRVSNPETASLVTTAPSTVVVQGPVTENPDVSGH